METGSRGPYSISRTCRKDLELQEEEEGHSSPLSFVFRYIKDLFSCKVRWSNNIIANISNYHSCQMMRIF